MKKFIAGCFSAIILLVGFVVNSVQAADSTNATSVGAVTPVAVITEVSTRKSFYLRLDPAAGTATVSCGPGSSDHNFKLVAGDVLVIDVKPMAAVYCLSNSGSVTVYTWER